MDERQKGDDHNLICMSKVCVLTQVVIPLNPRGLKDMKYDMGGFSGCWYNDSIAKRNHLLTQLVLLDW